MRDKWKWGMVVWEVFWSLASVWDGVTFNDRRVDPEGSILMASYWVIGGTFGIVMVEELIWFISRRKIDWVLWGFTIILILAWLVDIQLVTSFYK
jgi:hypothetical protein